MIIRQFIRETMGCSKRYTWHSDGSITIDSDGSHGRTYEKTIQPGPIADSLFNYLRRQF